MHSVDGIGKAGYVPETIPVLKRQTRPSQEGSFSLDGRAEWGSRRKATTNNSAMSGSFAGLGTELTSSG